MEMSKITELKYEVAVATEKEKNTRKELTELEIKLESSVSDARRREAKFQNEKISLQTELQEVSFLESDLWTRSDYFLNKPIS